MEKTDSQEKLEKEEKKVKKEKKTKEKKVKKESKAKDSKPKDKKEKKESYLKQVKKEMAVTHFPNKKDMIKYSIATIFFVIFFGAYFYLIELIMAFVKSLI